MDSLSAETIKLSPSCSNVYERMSVTLYNLGLDEKQQSYNKTFSNVLDALRKRINGFLDENLSLQDFFDKVKGAND